MAETELEFKTILYNDAAIAVGGWVQGVAYAPFDGFLVAAKVSGAGVEDGEIATSTAPPIQHIPGTDIAIDTDALIQLTPGNGNELGQSSFCILNQPVVVNERIDINYPNGTGTAEANWYFVFCKHAIGDGRYKLWQAAEDTIAVGSIIDYCPTSVPGLSRLVGLFIRGAGGQDMEVEFGPNGPRSQIVCRAIAVDTDAEPISALHKVNASPMPAHLTTTAYNGFTGVGMIYHVYD